MTLKSIIAFCSAEWRIQGMNTARIDIAYRPLRVAWTIASGDKAAFRQAVRCNTALRGGRFNPIVLADRTEEARKIIELYRADIVMPVGDSAAVKSFAESFSHLAIPFLPRNLYISDGKRQGRCQLLDVHNALAHWRDSPEWKALDQQGLRGFAFEADDPLADAFLAQYGDYPDAAETGVDYGAILAQATLCMRCDLPKNAPIPLDVLKHPGLGYLTRFGLTRHYSISPGWDFPGYFVGSAGDLDDLVCFWNLRAADIALQFIDRDHLSRYDAIRPDYERDTVARLAALAEHRRNIAVWSRRDDIDADLKLFPGLALSACHCGGPFFWNGGAVRPPMMMLGQASSLGVRDDAGGKPRVSFTLPEKPYDDDIWFATQRLVASVNVVGDEPGYTFDPPFVPEWNEFAGRAMNLYNTIRLEPERIGLVIDAADQDSYLHAIPEGSIIEQVFGMIGLEAKPSAGGLITRQLIARLGGLTGARVFKIPGVRQLIKRHGPRDTFTRNVGLQFIGRADPVNPNSKFSDHRQLYIEPRPFNTDLTAPLVFEYLVEKGLFRIGADLLCPSCQLQDWVALDALKQQVTCDLCGTPFDATRQLVNGEYHYRRSGVLGVERNAQGAVPVALTLQQLAIDFGFADRGIFAPSYDLAPGQGVDLPACETDLVIVLRQRLPKKTVVVIGECKDAGGKIDADDIAKLRRVADALPTNRFEVFLLFSKLGGFTDEEIQLTKSLNGEYQSRVILLTARELEPYHLFERTEKEIGRDLPSGSPAELAAATKFLYFGEA